MGQNWVCVFLWRPHLCWPTLALGRLGGNPASSAGPWGGGSASYAVHWATGLHSNSKPVQWKPHINTGGATTYAANKANWGPHFFPTLKPYEAHLALLAGTDAGVQEPELFSGLVFVLLFLQVPLLVMFGCLGSVLLGRDTVRIRGVFHKVLSCLNHSQLFSSNCLQSFWGFCFQLLIARSLLTRFYHVEV